MIKKLLSVLVLVFALSGSVLAQQSMSDQQVLEYVKTVSYTHLTLPTKRIV